MARRQQTERKRNILYLIAQYLSDFGYSASHDAFIKETHLTNDYRVCDNVDLDTIYLDYCSHYQLKFEKSPKIIKKVEQEPVSQRSNKFRRGLVSDGMSVSKDDGHVDATPLISNVENSLMAAMKVTAARQLCGDEKADEKCTMLRSLSGFLCHHPDNREMAEILQRYIYFIRESSIYFLSYKMRQGNCAT